MNRRGFLGFLGASPLVAKQVAEKAAMDLSGAKLGVGGENILSQGVPSGYSTANVTKSTTRGVIAKILQVGIPDFKIKEIKDVSKFVSGINPNIGVLRSVSLSTKFHMQRQQNYKENLKRFEDEYFNPTNEEREKFNNKYNWWL
ncbi:hypothetical protein [Lentilitoribacter sp. Alg239-R112]|uniref:hypothetical protein n=1 Tax=Lentilitoribacter sp. Alg239-R112 TaxID=2305987 RepID=UPI0013A6EA40|nr:hypothetical protein [Lentilitoribacter sp. Alg239-R112]